MNWIEFPFSTGFCGNNEWALVQKIFSIWFMSKFGFIQFGQPKKLAWLNLLLGLHEKMYLINKNGRENLLNSSLIELGHFDQSVD